MEIRLKVWAGSLAALGLVAALVLIPPAPPGWIDRDPDRARRPPTTAADERADSLQRVLTEARMGIAAWAVYDTLLGLVATDDWNGELRTILPPGLSREEGDRYARHLRARMDSVDALPSRIPVVRIHLPLEFFEAGAEGRVQNLLRLSPHVFLSRPDDPLFCAVVEAHREPDEGVRRHLQRARTVGGADRSRRGDPVTLCRFHARYGQSGTRIRSWLTGQGLHLATDQADDPAVLESRYAGELSWRYGAGRLLFGTGILGGHESLLPQRCVVGDGAACRRYVLEEATSSWLLQGGELEIPTPPNHRASSWNIAVWRGFGGYEASLLADVEAEFGQRAFRSFWTSERPVDDAFRNAFGESLGAYVHRWAVERVGTRPAGPGVPLASAALSLLFVGVCVSVGAWSAGRRTPA